MHNVAKPPRYKIRLRGLLGATLLTAFPGLQAENRDGSTVLTGTLADQAALHGALV